MEVNSVSEAIKVTADVLESVKVPAGLIREIGLPVSTALENLKYIYKLQKQAEEEAKAKQEEPTTGEEVEPDDSGQEAD